MQKRKYRGRNPLRKTEILDKAIELSERITYHLVNYTNLSEHSELPVPIIFHYFRSKKDLKKAIIRYAIEKEHLSLIAQGLVARDEAFLQETPLHLKTRAFKHIEKNMV